MWKVLSALTLFLLFGCGQSQSTGLDQQPAADNAHKQTVTEQADVPMLAGSETNAPEDNSPDIIQDKQYGINPQTIKIDSIDVESKVEEVGLLDNGQMGVPENFRITGWYSIGAKPGERGNAVIAGHVDDKTGPGVFFNLKDMEKGDKVEVSGKDGKTLTFKVVDKKVFPMDKAPVKKVFGYTSRRMLNLVTCTGPFDRSKGGHIDRMVVYTELVE